MTPTQCSSCSVALCSCHHIRTHADSLESPGSRRLCCRFLQKGFSPNPTLSPPCFPPAPLPEPTCSQSFSCFQSGPTWLPSPHRQPEPPALSPPISHKRSPGCPSVTSNPPHRKLTSPPAKLAPVYSQTVSVRTRPSAILSTKLLLLPSWDQFSFPPITSLSTNLHISAFENVSVLPLTPHPFCHQPRLSPSPSAMDHFRFSPDSFLVHFISHITSRSTFPNTTFVRIRPCSRTNSDFLLILNQIKLLLGFQDSSHLALPCLPNPVFHSSPPYTCHSVSLSGGR